MYWWNDWYIELHENYNENYESWKLMIGMIGILKNENSLVWIKNKILYVFFCFLFFFLYYDWYIEKWKFPCENKEQLNKREGEIIREIGTVNEYIAGRTLKEYYEDNKEKRKESRKKHRETNKEKLKSYEEKRKESRKEYKKEYYHRKKQEAKNPPKQIP
jgi:hypothetical protein